MPNSKGSDYPSAYNTINIRSRKPKSLTEWASYIFQCFDMRYAMNPVLVWTVYVTCGHETHTMALLFSCTY